MHLALQLGSTRRRTDDICTPSLAAVKCCGGTGRVDEEFVFDVPEGTDALLVTGNKRQKSSNNSCAHVLKQTTLELLFLLDLRWQEWS